MLPPPPQSQRSLSETMAGVRPNCYYRRLAKTLLGHLWRIIGFWGEGVFVSHNFSYHCMKNRKIYIFKYWKNDHPTRHFYSPKAVQTAFIRCFKILLVIFSHYYGVFCHILGFFYGILMKLSAIITNIHGNYGCQFAQIM